MADEDGTGGGDRHIELECVESLPLSEALAIVGEETRANILRALGEARSVDPAESDALRYSELMTAAEVEDSGRFNYHLERLVGTFVRKRDDGYDLRLPGRLLYQAFVAGTLTDRQRIDPFPVGDCPDCDGRLTAAYHPDHLLTVECTACETLYDAVHVPARSVAERSREDLLAAAYQRRHHKLAAMRRGVCPGCGGVVERTLRDAASVAYGDADTAEMAGLETYATLACDACHESLVGHPVNVALTLPAVVGFLADHGRDAALARWWEPPVAGARAATERVASAPPAVAVPFELDGHRLRVVLDDDLSAARVERQRE